MFYLLFFYNNGVLSFFFFFSSRSRHTRWPRDWSSDVCSSDLPAEGRALRPRGQRTVRRLLDAGAEVFAARGYHAARVDHIVRQARTSHGTFYLYFASKEDLFRALSLAVA